MVGIGGEDEGHVHKKSINVDRDWSRRDNSKKSWALTQKDKHTMDSSHQGILGNVHGKLLVGERVKK